MTAALTLPPVLLVIATAPLLLEAWLAHTPPNSTAILDGLSVAYLAGASTGVGYAIAVAAGEPGIVARTAVGVLYTFTPLVTVTVSVVVLLSGAVSVKVIVPV